jgi:hypothetical protein
MSGRRSIGSAGGARFFAAWLGLHALLLQLVLPVFHHPGHVFDSPAALASALVALGDAGSLPPAHHPSDGKTAPPCPLCLSIQHVQAFLAPTAPALLLPAPLGQRDVAAPPQDSVRWSNFAARARAPPRAA